METGGLEIDQKIYGWYHFLLVALWLSVCTRSYLVPPSHLFYISSLTPFYILLNFYFRLNLLSRIMKYSVSVIRLWTFTSYACHSHYEGYHGGLHAPEELMRQTSTRSMPCLRLRTLPKKHGGTIEMKEAARSFAAVDCNCSYKFPQSFADAKLCKLFKNGPCTYEIVACGLWTHRTGPNETEYENEIREWLCGIVRMDCIPSKSQQYSMRPRHEHISSAKNRSAR